MAKREGKAHPSFGMVRLSRISGHRGHMFGSSLHEHGGVIALEICEGDVVRDLYQDWYHSGKTLVEINLTASQFAELLTSMNYGSGVPCTIKRTHNGPVEPIKSGELQTEFDRIISELDSEAKGVNEQVFSFVNKAREKLAETKMPKGAKEEIDRLLVLVKSNLVANQKFVVQQSSRSISKVVTAAKFEIDAFVSGVIRATGLEQLRQLTPELPMIEEEQDED